METKNKSCYQVEILTPEKLFFSGEIQSLTMMTDIGEMCILKGHAQMLASISAGELRFLLCDGQERIGIHSEGFVEILCDRVMLFLQACESPEDVDAARAQIALDKANEKLRQKQSRVEYEHTKASIARAMTRLRVKRGM